MASESMVSARRQALKDSHALKVQVLRASAEEADLNVQGHGWLAVSVAASAAVFSFLSV